MKSPHKLKQVKIKWSLRHLDKPHASKRQEPLFSLTCCHEMHTGGTVPITKLGKQMRRGGNFQNSATAKYPQLPLQPRWLLMKRKPWNWTQRYRPSHSQPTSSSCMLCKWNRNLHFPPHPACALPCNWRA